MFATYNPAVRLYLPSTKRLIENHLLSLPPTDRFLRFFSFVTDESIKKYVSGIVLNDVYSSEAGFGVFDMTGTRLVGFAHVVPPNNVNPALSNVDSAEFALSVSVDSRKQGIGNYLFQRGMLHCESHGIKRVYMNCLADNHVMQRMAKRNGFKVVTSFGESVATLNVKDDKAVKSFVEAALSDQLALYDLGCRASMSTFLTLAGLLKREE